jgi:EAL domain-containing protein (putative c-di-GMP-specific phosphodiesterase class I)
MALDGARGESRRAESIAPEGGGELRLPVVIGEALTKSQLETWYQPKINLRRKCLAGAEAVARIRHPDLGLLKPGDFDLGTAENIVLASEQVLLAALDSWALFDGAGFNLTLAINIPIGALPDLALGKLIAARRPRAERWPGIILYLTEDEIVRDPALARRMTTRLQVGGTKIAIDNFGAGYSSLAGLREIPFVELRLDRSFVQDCALDRSKQAICQSAIDLSHGFGAAAAANGVSNQADLQTLMALGCDFGQGELIAPSMSQQQFLDLLREPVSKPQPQPVPVTPAKVNRLA